MEDLSKRRKPGASGVDRLSFLPDEILHEIMSRMKARQVVQTCVLSRRWRHLWRSVPCLDIVQKECAGAGAFADFAFALLHNVPVARLDAFQLHLAHSDCTSSGDDRNRKVSECIRPEMFGAQEPAGIQRVGLLLSPRSWRLRKLHLSSVFLDGLFAEQVRSGCPSLEDLQLTSCNCDFQAIASGSLKNLSLETCMWTQLTEITSPTLKSLVLDSGCKDDIVVVSKTGSNDTVSPLSMLHLAYATENSPMLEKLTLRCCKSPKSKNTPSTQCHNLVDERCDNLKLTEIIYENDGFIQPVELLLLLSRNLPNNRIRLTKLD